MKLTTVTITGAADDTDIGALVDLSAEFPFVEWGILVSASQEGWARFPSRRWMKVFSNADLRVATHLCGRWVRQLLVGELDWEQAAPDIRLVSQRWQINTHGSAHPWTGNGLDGLRAAAAYTVMPSALRHVIFQHDGANNGLPCAARTAGIRTQVLFDSSGGGGILPGAWPPPLPSFRCGYAGGLGPDNVAAQLSLVATACDEPCWIDMERRVRSDDVLDLAKVRAVLEIWVVS
jgi:hypothetical protein